MGIVPAPQIIPESRKESVAKLGAVMSSAAPWIGGPISEILGGYANDLKIKRVTDFVEGVLNYTDRLHSKIAEEFVRSEDFMDILDKTMHQTANKRYEEKRKLYSNFIVNNIKHPDIAYDARLEMLRLIDQVDFRHISLLLAALTSPQRDEEEMNVSSPSNTIGRRAPHIKNDLDILLHRTNILGLTNTLKDALNVTMTGSGAANLAHFVTPLGKNLIEFLKEPFSQN